MRMDVEVVPDNGEGTGVGLRIPGNGEALRTTAGGCGVERLSELGGKFDARFTDEADGGSGVRRLSGGGIVDLRADVGAPEGGSGVVRFSGGMVECLREDAGSTDARPTPKSSSMGSNGSPLRGSVAGTNVEERRDEPRAELCGGGTSGGVFPIVTKLTLVDFSQRVIHSLRQGAISLALDHHTAPLLCAPYIPAKSQVYLVFFDLVEQCAVADLQHFGCPRPIAFGFLQRPTNQNLFDDA